MIDSVENDKIAGWYNERPRHRPGHPAPAGHQHRRGGRRDQGAAADLPEPASRPRSTSTSSTTVPCRSGSRCDDVKFTLVLTLVPGGPGDLPLPAELSATIIPSLALPMSIVGTFAVMYLLGFSLDNLSLMALTLSVGFVVDDAIVMLENIVRHMEMGERRAGGGPQGLAGDRLHHRVHDPLAGGGLHPGALHGRHRRPAAPRVRRHHRRGRS